MFKLRGYQQSVVDKIRGAWQRVRSVLAVVPTGGGKTVIFSSILRDHEGAGLAVVHRKEIVTQISLSLARLGIRHRIIAPPKTVTRIRRKHLRILGENFLDPQAAIGVASVQTLTSAKAEKNLALNRWLDQITLCIYDEGHHYVKNGIWAKAVDRMARARLLFVTATPERADGIGLGTDQQGGGGFIEEMVEGPTAEWLIENGFLCGFSYKAPKTDLDVEGLAVGKNGDFNATALRARVVESHIVGDVVRHYLTFAPGKRTIVFATDVKTAEDMAEAFKAAGFTAEALSGDTDAGIRDAALDRFESGATQVLVNVDLFDEGFDVPAVECVLMARPTQSLAKFLQMVGRALRIMEGKAQAIIIDPVRNWERHGGPNWPREWSLKSRDKREGAGKSDTVPQRICMSCTSPYEAFFKACPYCGAVPEPVGRSLPEQVDGELMELDMVAMAALFKKKQDANMSAHDFEKDLIARNVPPLARGPAIRRHENAKYRRDVLHNLVGWWVGAQQGRRSEGEIQRRFFHRFGVDIMTAFTLDEKGTDALCEKVAKNFSHDAA